MTHSQVICLVFGVVVVFGFAYNIGIGGGVKNMSVTEFWFHIGLATLGFWGAFG